MTLDRSIGSRDSGARYYAEGGRVYARLPDGRVEEAATALSANGREVTRHDAALQIARASIRIGVGMRLRDTSKSASTKLRDRSA